MQTIRDNFNFEKHIDFLKTNFDRINQINYHLIVGSKQNHSITW